MAKKPCGYLVVSDGKGGLAKLHLEDAVADLRLTDKDIEALLAKLVDDAPARPAAPPRGGAPPPPLAPAERLAVLTESLGKLLLRAEGEAARLPWFRETLSAAIGRGLAAARDPAVANALRAALARARKGLWSMSPPSRDIEAIATLLPWKERYPLVARWGQAMHQATFAELRASIAANPELAGWTVQTDRTLGTLVQDLGGTANPAYARRVMSMTVEDYLTKIIGRAPATSGEAKLEKALIRTFGTTRETTKGVRLDALRPDIVLLDPGKRIRGLYDLTSLNQAHIELAAELAAAELMMSYDEFRVLRGLSLEAAGHAVLNSTSPRAATEILIKSKALHARRGALVQHVLGHLDLMGAAQTGEFYYPGLRVWGPPILP